MIVDDNEEIYQINIPTDKVIFWNVAGTTSRVYPAYYTSLDEYEEQRKKEKLYGDKKSNVGVGRSPE